MIDLADYYRQMYLIRRFEENILNLFSENKLTGTTHTYIGQEAIAVSSMNSISENDCVFSNHRCHGHFIAYSKKPELLLHEIMGDKYGLCAGRGGSQHINYKNFYTNGVQGGIVPNAVGMALAEKIKNTDNIAVVFLGDGTLGQGVVYESMNIASCYSAPVLFIVEDNAYAMTTKTNDGVSGSIIDRAKAFAIDCDEITSNDVVLLSEKFERVVNFVREKKKPFFFVVHTYRLGPHSKGDDFRNPEEINEHRKKDPLLLAASKLDKLVVDKIKNDVDCYLSKIISECESKRLEIQEFTYSEEHRVEIIEDSLLNSNALKCCKDLRNGLDNILKNDDVIIMGEDIKDPYGGAFKVTKGLCERHNEKIWNMPISEAGFTGIAIGMAMRGIKTVVDYMFGDFISLGFDQILNHGTKYNWMYNNKVTVPVLIRLPMGGGRGYGPTHSQTLEKYFIGIPNIVILAVNSFISGEKLLERIYKNIKSPTLLIENKKLYGKMLNCVDSGKFNNLFVEETKDVYPIIKFSYSKTEKNDVVFITYGVVTDVCLEVTEKLMMKDEINSVVVSLTKITPINYEQLVAYCEDCKLVITVEEGTRRNCWGSDVISNLIDKDLKCKFKCLASEDSVIPTNSEQEYNMLINADKVYNTVIGEL